MHFISLVAVEMPKIKENQAENQEVENVWKNYEKPISRIQKISCLNCKSRDCRGLPQSLPVLLTIVCAKL